MIEDPRFLAGFFLIRTVFLSEKEAPISSIRSWGFYCGLRSGRRLRNHDLQQYFLSASLGPGLARRRNCLAKVAQGARAGWPW